MQLGNARSKTKKLATFYDPPQPVPSEKYDPEVKKLNELVRRWKVHLYQIELTNSLATPIDPFLQIVIGGDFFIEIKKGSS